MSTLFASIVGVRLGLCVTTRMAFRVRPAFFEMVNSLHSNINYTNSVAILTNLKGDFMKVARVVSA